MNISTADLESRLKRAAAVAAPPRSMVDDVMQQLGSSRPDAPPRRILRHPLLVAGIAALGGAAAIVAIVFFLSGSVSLSLADVQKAFEGQRWVHIHYDTGGIKDDWTDLQTGETYLTRDDGDAVYLNDRTNTRLWYWKRSGMIEQDQPTIYRPGTKPPAWTPKSAWGDLVAPLARFAATQPAHGSPPPVVAVKDVLNGKPAIRFDVYMTDGTGARFIYSQLWADPQSHLPLRRRERLQLADREQYGKEWSTGDYDFPATGPPDLYAIGVPRGTSIHRDVTVAPPDVAPLLAGVIRAHDQFLKNYRAVVWVLPASEKMPVGGFEVIWRDGQQLRDDQFAWAYGRNDQLRTPARDATVPILLDWAAHHPPVEMQLMATDADYFWRSTSFTKGSKPQVHVTRRNPRSLLARNSWPDEIQWPIWESGPDFKLSDRNADTPSGCVGLRTGGDGNQRTDYYFDPANDYVCLKQIDWAKRQGAWTKTSQTTLSDLHRIDGRVVAGVQTAIHYDDPAEGIYEYTQTTRIQLDVVSAADYPPGIFDPSALTQGATVEGY